MATQAPSPAAPVARRRFRHHLLTRRDVIILALMLGIPTLWHVFFVWGPTIASIGLYSLGGMGSEG